MIKHIIFTLTAIAMSCSLLSQNEQDVLRLSFNNSFSTARSAGMGGAFGALGADFSSLSTNPAGLGLYRRVEFGLTPSFAYNRTNTEFNNSTEGDGDFNFKLNSIGYVYNQESASTDRKKVMVGIGYNRLNNFGSNFTQNGTSDNNLLDLFAVQAQSAGIPYYNLFDELPSSAGLAWDAYLLDTIPGTIDQYESAIHTGKSVHSTEVKRSGGSGEILIGTGVNIRDRFFWGLSLGIPLVNYEEEFTLTESPVENLDLSSYTYTETLEVSGGGLNLKAGIILKPSQWMRIGAAYHTSTVYNLRDNYTRGIESVFTSGPYAGIYTPDDFVGVYEYKIKTPSKYQFNAAFILGKTGLVSADYEYIDYSKGELRPGSLSVDGYDFAAENSNVRQLYRGTHNVRVGSELRYGNYRFRFGVRLQQDPYTEDVNDDAFSAPIKTYSAGFGFRKQNFFIDVASNFYSNTDGFYAYSPSLIDQASVKAFQTHLTTTLGWRY